MTSKVLVVDDEVDIESLVKMRMRRDIRRGDFEFLFALDGMEAVEILTEDRDIDIIVTDINMPRMDGLTLLGEIARINPDTRSIVVSAYGDMPNIRTAMNRGAFDFVVKPLNFDDFRVTVNRAAAHLAEWRSAQLSQQRLQALEGELLFAQNIQRSILPDVFPKTHSYEIEADMLPAREIGGDFYDFMYLANGKIGITIADVSDKGIPAALFMMATRTMLKGAALTHNHPGDVLNEVNGLISQENEEAMFVTIFYGVYDPMDGSLSYANGGHEPPLLVMRDGTVSKLPLTNGIALGLVPGAKYAQHSTHLMPGDSIVCYTDGATDATNGDGQRFGLERLRNIFEGKPPIDTVAAIKSTFNVIDEFVGGAPQADDLTCLSLLRHH